MAAKAFMEIVDKLIAKLEDMKKDEEESTEESKEE